MVTGDNYTFIGITVFIDPFAYLVKGSFFE